MLVTPGSTTTRWLARSTSRMRRIRVSEINRPSSTRSAFTSGLRSVGWRSAAPSVCGGGPSPHDGPAPAVTSRPSNPNTLRNGSRMRVSLFVTCFNDTLFPQTGRTIVRLLERLGCEVDFPLEQTCCGQMHMNSGYAREGLALARRLERVFEDSEHVVTPSASCAGMLRQQVDTQVYELSEFLVDVMGVEDVGASFPHRVTFHPTCHSLRELHTADRPFRLLQAVSGIDLVELPSAT